MTTEARQLGLEAVDVKAAEPDDLVMWSVTTIIGVIEKPALLYWSAGMTADAAIDSLKSLPRRIEEDGRQETWKWLRDARFRQPKEQLRATDLGSAFHAAAEQYALTGTRPDHRELQSMVIQKGGKYFTGAAAEVSTLSKMLDQFDGWLQRFSPTYEATEVAVYHPEFRYAGTCDAFLTVGGTRFIADYKTSREALDSRGKPRTPYPEQVALQLAAYRFAKFAAVWRPRRTEKFRRRYYLVSEAEQAMSEPVPEVDAGLAIQVTPESCEAYPIDVGEQTHKSFLHTMEVFRWVQELSKSAMADPLMETI